ncbi:MAG: efflux RND transporter periplasmic adaptor subunit, partial [Candidatus Cloacimonetes bacterium]|nr:efflux RND transporter periplasmic adaptor subunit [Candidatus Cloacimonadota bacterium]
MKKLIIPIIILVSIAMAGFIFYNKRNTNTKTVYEFTNIQRGNILNSVSSTGTLETVGSVEVGTQVSGTIEKVLVDFNEMVKKGQVLAVLDTTQLSLSVKTAKADLKKIKAQYELSFLKHRDNLSLFKDGYISEWDIKSSEMDLLIQKTQLEMTEISLQKAERNLYNYAIIRSPIDGQVISRNIEPGQTVASSFSAPTLFLIAKDLTTMRIFALVDESDIGQIKKGQKANLGVDAYPDLEFSGKVEEIRLQPTTISNVVNYTVVVSASNPESLLLPGMTATIEFITEEKIDVLL